MSVNIFYVILQDAIKSEQFTLTDFDGWVHQINKWLGMAICN